MAGQRQQLDSQIEIVTPENIAFRYRVAGPFQRLPAYILDLAFRTTGILLIGIVILFFFGTLGLEGLGAGIVLIAWFILDVFYGGLFEALWNGQTPGKRLMQLRVLTIEGTPIQGWQAVLRNVLRFADGMPVLIVAPLYLLGLLISATNDRFQRLGDMAAGTMVVVEEPYRQPGVIRMEEPRALQIAAMLPPHFRASRSLSRALSNYVQRRQLFSWQRRMEIAMHLAAPLAKRLGLPSNIDPDQLLCAVYFKTFIADRPESGAGRGERQGAKSAARPPEPARSRARL